MTSRSNSAPAVFLAAIAVLAGIGLRVLYLGSDPSYPSWIGWLADEGRWTQVARDWAVLGEADVGEPLNRSHLILAPLYQAVQAFSFQVFGVGAAVARWVSVVAGLGLLAIAARFVRGRLDVGASALVVGVLALQPDLVFFSRVAIPEMASLALQLASFALLVGAPRTRSRAFRAGLVMALAMGFKGTIAPLLPVFVVVALATSRTDDPASRWARCAAFVAPIFALALVFAGALAAAAGGLQALYSSAGALQDILGFLRLDSLYGALAVLYTGEWAVRVNVVLAAIWPLCVALALGGAPDSEERTILIGAGTWALGWIGLWSVLVYFPERWVVHVHVPLALALGAGVAALRSRESHVRAAIESTASRWTRWPFAFAFAVPSGVQFAAAAVSLGALAGVPTGGLSVHGLLMVGLTVVLGVGLALRWSVGSVSAIGFGLPFGMAVAWSAADLLGAFAERYWAGHGGDLVVWAGIIAVGLITALLATRVGPDGTRVRRFVVAYAGALTLVWTADRVHRLTVRTYVADEIREFLVDRYPEGTIIGVQAASSVLIDTPFRVRNLHPNRPATQVILALENDTPFFQLQYHDAVAEFGVPFGPRHFYPDPAWDRIGVYESVEGAPDPPGLLRRENP